MNERRNAKEKRPKKKRYVIGYKKLSQRNVVADLDLKFGKSPKTRFDPFQGIIK